jgi:Fe/S biogenesis protein NfuA
MTGQYLSVTDEAIDKIVAIRNAEPPGDGEFALFLEVTGDTGMQFTYDLSFMPLADAEPTDVVERFGDLAIVMPGRDVDKLDGAELRISGSSLAIENPNAPRSPLVGMGGVPGDLEGPLANRVAQVLEQQVNPAIAGHGGAARLVSVDDTVAYLELMGGCQGCGMAAVTLKQGIERILHDTIPELTGVVDVTDHASGDNPYYQSAKK